MHPLVRFFKLAAKAGPLVYATGRALAPYIKRLIAEDPERFHVMMHRLSSTVATKNPLASNKDEQLASRCAVLRDHVTYLYASADNAEEAERAVAWRDALENIEKALPLLNALSSSSRRTQVKNLNRRLDRLAEEILAASITEEIEDAYVFPEEDTPNSESGRKEEE